MSPRPRTVPDDEILQATRRAIARLGPQRLTLSSVAHGCGLSPATLLQRFGSKHNLLMELARDDAARAAAVFTHAFRPELSPVEQLVEALTSVATAFASPDAAANMLAFQLAESSQPGFRDQLVSRLAAEVSATTELVEEAVADGELTDCDARVVARALIDIRNGVLMSWALDRHADAPSRVRAALAAVLDPWRARPRLR